MRDVCQKHGFACKQVIPGVPGTFPTFVAETDMDADQKLFSVVVKFFGPLFNGAGSFHIERELGQWLGIHPLPIPSPAILAEGQLDHDWWYLIFERVAGVSIGQVMDKLSMDDWLVVARQMGEYMRCLHDHTMSKYPGLPISMTPSMNKYARFLKQQRRTCLANHQAWNDLPSHLLDQLEGFVLPVDQLVDFNASPHLIHADLTADHLLGRLVNDRWQTLAVIDWGDAMTGNLLYELVALHLDLFRSNTTLLRVCLEAYGLPAFYQHDLPRKALSMVLLHPFPMPAWVYQTHWNTRTLPELADDLFAI